MPEVIHSKHFVQGIREDTRVPVGSESLLTCNGMKATEFGASKELVIADGTDGLTANWPFPQLFKGEGFTLALDSDVLYLIQDDGTKQALTVYDPTTSGSELLAHTTFTSGTGWSAGTGWSFVGSTAVKTAGSEAAVTDTGTTLTAPGLYRFALTFSAVSTAASGNDRVYVKIGNDSSEKIIPRVGTIELEVYAEGPGVIITFYGESNAAFTLASVSCKLIAEIADLSFSSTTKPFHMASFKKVWMLASDAAIILCAPICGTQGAYSGSDFQFNWRIVKYTTTQLGAAANYNERLYLGDFDRTDARYDAAEFTTMFDIFVKKHIGVMYENFEVSRNVVFYGQPFGGDISYPFSADLALFGLLDSTQSAAFVTVLNQSLRDGTVGFFELPTPGRVLRLVPLGGYLIAYCTTGVCSIRPMEDNANVHMVNMISQVGLADKGAVSHDSALSFHMYLGVNGKLQIVTNEMIVRELGYEEVLATLVTNKGTYPPILCVDPDESEVYIGNSQVSYLRSRSGLGQIWTAVTSLYNSAADGLIGSIDDLSPGDGLARIRTMPTDYGTRSFKSVHDVEVGAYDITNGKVRVHYKNDHSSTFYATEWFNIINGGFTVPLVSGYEFSYELEFTPGANARIEYLKVDWQIRDHRNFRRQAGRV